jgi:phospholipase/lecithinase/hemolysin
MVSAGFILLSLIVTSTYAWNIPNFTNLVVFGDSWSDAGWLNYIIAHNGSLPPVGWTNNEVRATGSMNEYKSDF